MTIFVQSLQSQLKTHVEIVTRRAMAANFTAADWQKRLTNDLDQRLGAGAVTK